MKSEIKKNEMSFTYTATNFRETQCKIFEFDL